MKSITIAGVTVHPGEHKLVRIPVARMPRGDTLELAVRAVVGLHDGPVLGLESGSHGDEAFAIRTIHEVLGGLDPTTLRGAVLGLPVCNPVAFETFTRLTGIGMTTDAVNLNVVFPGSPSGSLVAQMAHAIATEYLPHLDALIDFHSGGIESAIDYTLVKQSGGPVSPRILELSKAFGSDYLSITRTEPDSVSSISELAESLGIPAVVAMLGGSVTSGDDKVLARSVAGVHNVMRMLGMLPGAPTRNPRQAVIGDRKLVRHLQGGVFIPAVGFDKLGAVVPKGTPVGSVRDANTFEALEEYVAPFDETILIMIRGVFGRVFAGDYAYIFGDADTAKPA